MKFLAVLLMLPYYVLGHITEDERPWIIGIQDAAKKIEEENKLLAGLLETAGEKRASAEQSVGRYEVLYGQLQTEHITAQKAVEDLTEWGVAQQARADKAELNSVKKDKRILQLYILSAVLGLGFVGLAYLLVKS